MDFLHCVCVGQLTVQEAAVRVLLHHLGTPCKYVFDVTSVGQRKYVFDVTSVGQRKYVFDVTSVGQRKYVFDVTSVGQRSSPWTCNSVKVEIKFHLECKLHFPSAQLMIRQMHLTIVFESIEAKY